MSGSQPVDRAEDAPGVGTPPGGEGGGAGAKRAWVRTVLKVQGPEEEGTRARSNAVLGDERRVALKAAFEKSLSRAIDAIEGARGIGPVGTRHGTMETSLRTAISSAKGGDYPAALAALVTASGEAAAINGAEEARRDAHLQAHGLAARARRTLEGFDALATLPNPVRTARQSVDAPRTAMETALSLDPEDLADSTAKMGGFSTAVDALTTAALTEAQTRHGDLATRARPMLDNQSGNPGGAAQLRRRSTYLAKAKAAAAAIAGGDGAAALAACDVAEVALTTFEQGRNPSQQQKAAAVTAARDAVAATSVKDLKAKPLAERAELALDLCAAGEPPKGSAAQKALIKLYAACPPDPLFTKERDEQRAQIADRVSKLPELTALFDARGKLDSKAWKSFAKDPARVKDLLTKVGAEQCAVLGLPPIQVTTYVDKPGFLDFGVDYGGYEPGNNRISLNTDTSAISSPLEALGTILHETNHYHQDVLCKRLKSGELGPDDPLYPQVLLFVCNDVGIGYLQGDEVGQKAYEEQPTEIDAEVEGKKMAASVLLSIKAASKKKP